MEEDLNEDFIEKKAKANEELVACWCWLCVALVVVAVCVGVVKCLIALWRYHGM